MNEKITDKVIQNHNLTKKEYKLVKKILGRIPNLLELGIFSVMWSEHCSYKSTKKWLLIKFSSLFLIPFMAWFIINFVSIINNDYNSLIAFLSEQPSKILFSIFVFLSLFFYSLTISEIFEDYMSNEKIKNVANKLVFIFAILLSLGTIITIYNL